MDLLAAVQQGNGHEQLYCFYEEWGCLGAFAPLVVAVGTFLVVLILNMQKWTSEFKTNLLLAKEGVATVFMDTVIFEAQLLLNLVEEHLPGSITQALKSKPLKTKFDEFCEKLIEISKSSAGNPRTEISLILEKEKVFSGLIVSEAKKLVNIIKLSPRLEHTDYNSTHIGYALQGDTALKFSFIAERLFALEKIRKKYTFSLNGSLSFAILSLLGFSSFLIPLMWRREFCNIWGYISLTAFVVSAIISVGLFVRAHRKSGQLINLKNESDFKSAYENWKTRNETKKNN